jgi:hypothetical protein
MRTSKRSEVPSIDRGPLPRNALSDVRLRTSRAPRLCHRVARSRRLCTPASPFEISRELGRRPRDPVASGDHASLGLGRRSPTSATVTTHGHTLRAADPRTRVGLSPRCTPAPTDAGCVGLSGALPHRGPASRNPLTPAFTPTCSACADETNRGSRRSSKGEPRALFTMSRVPFS